MDFSVAWLSRCHPSPPGREKWMQKRWLSGKSAGQQKSGPWSTYACQVQHACMIDGQHLKNASRNLDTECRQILVVNRLPCSYLYTTVELE